jgi:hypothetical protein
MLADLAASISPLMEMPPCIFPPGLAITTDTGSAVSAVCFSPVPEQPVIKSKPEAIEAISNCFVYIITAYSMVDNFI